VGASDIADFRGKNLGFSSAFLFLSISKAIRFMNHCAVHQLIVKLSRAALMALQQLVGEYHMTTSRKKNLGDARAFLFYLFPRSSGLWNHFFENSQFTSPW